MRTTTREDVTSELERYSINFDLMRNVAIAYWGERGGFSYDVYRWANAALFENRINVPAIQWSLTAYGKCLAQIFPRIERPVITVHPSVWHLGELHPTYQRDAWGGVWGGLLYVSDVMIHELLHVFIECKLADAGLVGLRRPRWTTSHDNDDSAREVMRISSLLGRGNVIASRTKKKRDNGQMLTVPSVDGSISMKALAAWPWSLRAPDYPQTGQLPFEWNPPPKNR